MKNFFKAHFAPVIGNLTRATNAAKVPLGIIALVAVIGFSMAALSLTSCGGDSVNDSGGNEKDLGFTSDLSGKTVQLVINEYSIFSSESKGLQGIFRDPAMMQRKKVNRGDKFKLNITFKLDKSLDTEMYIYMADMSSAANYYKMLTSTGSYGAPDYYIMSQDLVANTEIKKEFILTATETATSNAVDANTLVFDCYAAWSESPVTITFVSFTFTKLVPDEGE